MFQNYASDGKHALNLMILLHGKNKKVGELTN